MAHRKTIQHVHEPGHLHEFTFSCYRRKQLLTNDSLLEILSRTLDAAGAAEGFQLLAFVFMPEHIHLLTLPTTAEPNFGRYLGLIKQPFSKQIKEVLLSQRSSLIEQLTVRERPGKTCFRFWQEGPGYDRNLTSRAAILASPDYIPKNPVQRGLCVKAIDWKWSSARYHLLEPPCQQFPELPRLHPFPSGVFD